MDALVNIRRTADYHLVMSEIERNKKMTRPYDLSERAETDSEKEEVMRRILEVWKQVPQLRLTQLIVNSVGPDPFYIEDKKLVQSVENYIS